MMNLHTQETNSRLLAAVAPLADLAALSALLLVMPRLVRPLQQPSGWNVLLIVLVYLLFCAGVYLLRKLIPQPEAGRWQPPAWFMDRRVRGVIGLLFGLLLMTAIAYQLGFFEAIQMLSPGALEEGSTAAFYVFGPGAWLGFSMLYILVLAFTVRPTLPPHAAHYATVALLALLFTNTMLLIATAQITGLISQWGMRGVMPFVAVLTLLTLAFLPPRLLYQNRQPHLSGLISMSILLLASAWWAAFMG